MSRISSATLALCTLLALACQGCAALEYHEYSAPVLGPDRRPVIGNGVTIQLEEMVIAIESSNSDWRFALVGPYPVPIIPFWHSPKHSAPLKIQVALSVRGQPETLQGTQSSDSEPDQNKPERGVITFHPMKVTLESNGTALSPTGFYGFKRESSAPTHAVRTDSRYYSCHKKGDSETQGEVLTEDREISFAGKGCVWLEFARTSSPDEPFTLRVDGVTLDSRPVEVPSFHFQKGSAWFLYGLP